MAFGQKILLSLESAAVITVSILSTALCLTLGTLAVTRTADWCRGVKGGTTFKDVKSFISQPEVLNFAATAATAYTINCAEARNPR